MIGACPLTSCAPADVTQTAQRAFSTDPPNRPPCPVTPESDTLRLYGQQRRRCAFLPGPAHPPDHHATSCVDRTAQRVPASSGRAPVSCRAACRAARRAGGPLREASSALCILRGTHTSAGPPRNLLHRSDCTTHPPTGDPPLCAGACAPMHQAGLQTHLTPLLMSGWSGWSGCGQGGGLADFHWDPAKFGNRCNRRVRLVRLVRFPARGWACGLSLGSGQVWDPVKFGIRRNRRVRLVRLVRFPARGWACGLSLGSKFGIRPSLGSGETAVSGWSGSQQGGGPADFHWDPSLGSGETA